MDELMNCPMMNKKIDLAYCLELQMISNNEIKKTADEKRNHGANVGYMQELS